LLGGAVVLVLCLRNGPAAQPEPEGEALEVGHETTRLTGPLTPDGRVDYAAALNAVGAPDPEENAAIPLLRLLGTNSLVGNRAEVLRLLRAPDDLPADGIFVPAPEDLPLSMSFLDMEPREQELLLEWLRSNEAALEGVVEASRRPRLWWPVVDDLQIGALRFALPIETALELEAALIQRTEIALAEGRAEGAWADLQALLRLLAHVDRLPGLVVRLITSGRLATTLDLLSRAIRSGALDEQRCREAVAVLQELEPVGSLADDLDGFDRFFVLGCLVAGTLDERARSGGGEASDPGLGELNATLRTVNRAHDEIVPLLRAGTREGEEEVKRRVEERHRRVRRLRQELETMLGKARAILERAIEGDEWVGSQDGEVLSAAVLGVVPIILRRQRTCEAQRRRVLIAVALRLHALRNRQFPATLEALVPETLPAIPTNALDDQPFAYERTDTGCVLDTGDFVIALTR